MEGGGAPFSSSMAPSGSYILIIVSQPVTDEHKKVILERLNKGLLSWDVESTGCDLSCLETVCSGINAKHLNDTDVLIQHSTESLGVEVLVSPTVSTLKQCVKNLFSTSTGHKHLIHAGYTFAGSGSWILQNGTFSFDEFLEIFQQADVQNQKRCNINVHCTEIGSWNSASFAKDIFTKVANVAFNPIEKVSSVPGSEHLISCLEKVLSSQALEEIMEASTLVGNIRFNRPTLYMFPAGQGDCSLFGINGFNMLIDGGFNRKPCSWEFIRHLDRLDAVLVTRLCENNVCGMSTLMKRKSLNNTYPQIGYVFCNIAETKGPSPKEILSKDDLIVSVVGEGHNFTNMLNELKLKPHQCWRDSSVEPFVLYHKVGHGTLEMHVLSPPKDSKEMKEFMTEWSSYKETFSCVKSGLKTKSLESAIPLSHSTSICAVLVWRPADPKDTITRILFPGSAPQSKIFESLEKLKNLDVLKQPIVTKASLSVVVAKTVNKVEKSVSRASIPNRKNTASPALSVSSVASRNGDISGVKKEVKKVVKEVKKDNKDVKKEVKKEVKKDSVPKEVKKTTTVPKREAAVKKEAIPKDVKKDNKDIKQVVKKDSKDLKAVIDKKVEVKSSLKKVESASTVSKTVSEVKRTASTAVRKSTTPIKKEVVSKTTAAHKSGEVKKSAPSKVSEPKAAKDVSNKKAAEAKAVAKSKSKSANTTPKTAPKTKSDVPKPGTKVTKAVAASSIVASAVAVTVAAFELNEKKEEIIDVEPEPESIDEKEPEIADLKDLGITEKSEEVNVSPLPPEALSPTPSESISLTPSDTLSSAPLETVSPTPPLANEPMSMEEKEVNEIKDIEQDLMPYETESTDEAAVETVEINPTEEQPDEINEIELELAKRQEHTDVMSTSFIGSKDLEAQEIEEVISKTEAATELFSASGVQNVDSEKFPESEKHSNDEIYKEDVKETEFSDYAKECERNVDDQLAHLSMEGSFCAGVTSYGQENTDFGVIEDSNIISEIEQPTNDFSDQGMSSMSTVKEVEVIDNEKEMEQQHQLEMHESFIGASNIEDKPEETAENITETQYESESVDQFSHSNQNAGITAESNFQDNKFTSDDLESKYTTEIQEKEVIDEKYHEDDRFSPEPLQNSEYLDEQEYTKHHDIHSMEGSLSHRVAADDYDISRNIIEDSEMLETSVDEPEEILRKESAVSITLNDDGLGVDYDDEMRRKSYTESEDDVDIQNYMITDRKDSFEQDKLNARRDVDSDDEDVVKSPTPHAIVDYEGHIDDVTHEKSEQGDQPIDTQEENPVYFTEKKQDFDEKDRDSAEEQEDTDDGEMIRHPTPPEMKYSEDEMRDPIGQHYITAPGLKSQIPGITEQPLYEESEDAISERSVSPVVEQPVFGNIGQADFPELVTVSGGTTPSEPQSPKSGFDCKKFGSETAVMDALSEHDCSESSTHSPLCHDGTTAFEMPVSEETFVKGNLEVHTDEQQDMSHELDSKNVHLDEPKEDTITPSHEELLDNNAPSQEELLDNNAPSQEELLDNNAPSQELLDNNAPGHEELLDNNASSHEELLDKNASSHEELLVNSGPSHEEEFLDINAPNHKELLENNVPTYDDLGNTPVNNYDAPSDEESYSQNDKSETRSEKSDGEEEKSDIHRDDRSDHQHDGKSDIMDDDQIERKSDIQEDDRSDSYYDDKQDGYDGKGENSYDVAEDTRSHTYGSEEFHTNEAKNHDMQYERYEVQEDFQYNATDDHDDVKTNYKVSDIQEEKSFEDKIEKQEFTESIIHDDFISDTSETRSDAPQYHGMFGGDNINVPDGIESNIDRNLENLTVEHEDTMMNEEIQDKFDIPSNFHDDEKDCVSDNYSSNIPSGESFSASGISNQIPLDADKINLDQLQSSGNFESSYNQYEDVLTKETDIECTKEDISEYQGSDYINYEDERSGMMNQELMNQELTNKSSFPEDMSLDGSKFQESEERNLSYTQSGSHDDISPQHTESLSGLENKVLTEITEAHQYETLSKFEENVHTSNVAYNESSSFSNLVSEDIERQETYPETHDAEDKNLNLISEETKYSISEKNFGYSSDFKNEHDFHGQMEETSYSMMSSSVHGTIDELHDEKPYGYTGGFNFSSGNHGMDVIGSHGFPVPGVIADEEVQDTITGMDSGTRTEYHQEFESEVVHNDSEGNNVIGSTTQSTFGMLNGKDKTSWSHTTSEYTTQYATETSSSVTQEQTGYTNTEQENSYIINSRFHSDSPEDNIMRSDSSPDVPPYPLDSTGQLADLKNSISVESQSFNTTNDDYPNMNLPNVAAVPLSPNKTRNANRDSPYGESSEDEDSSSIPGTVSPYAYTNKAYAKEEEDVDGNHLYKESVSIEKTADIMKEFDGNNPQTTTTHQVGYSQGYQETEYTGETNYDFRLEEWEKPMGLPTPPDSSQKTVAKKTDKHGVKSLHKSAADTNGKAYSPGVSKMSSPMKKPKGTKESSSSPVYVDLAYVPHHGDPQYCDVEFFKKIRARYYVFSGINPSKEVLNALLEAKKSWKEDLEVTIIPTYETDTLGYWMAQNQDDLAEYSIEVAPSASRCTVNLQDHETSCAAYRLEF